MKRQTLILDRPPKIFGVLAFLTLLYVLVGVFILITNNTSGPFIRIASLLPIVASLIIFGSDHVFLRSLSGKGYSLNRSDFYLYRKELLIYRYGIPPRDELAVIISSRKDIDLLKLYVDVQKEREPYRPEGS